MTRFLRDAYCGAACLGLTVLVLTKWSTPVFLVFMGLGLFAVTLKDVAIARWRTRRERLLKSEGVRDGVGPSVLGVHDEASTIETLPHSHLPVQ